MLRSSLLRRLQKVLISPARIHIKVKVSGSNVDAGTAGTNTPSANAVARARFHSGTGGSAPRSHRSAWIALPVLPAAFFGLWKTEEDDMSAEDKILLDIKRGILSIKKDQLDKAEKYLTRALAKSQEEKLDSAITQILGIQANLALQKGDWSSAERLLKLTAQRLVGVQGIPMTDNAIVEMSIKLAQLYEKTGHLDRAMSGYEYCVKVQKEKLEKNEINGDTEEAQALMVDSLLLLVWASHSLSQMHMKFATTPGVDEDDKKDHIQKAADLSSDAYRYATQAEGPDSVHAVTVQSDLGTITAVRGDVDSAIRTLMEAEVIAKEKYAELYPSISVNIGNLYIQKGLYDEAKKICEQAKLFAGKMSDMDAFQRAHECMLKCAKLQDEKKKNEAVMLGQVGAHRLDFQH